MAGRIVMAIVMAAGAGWAMTAPASALIACNPQGDCWHADRREAVPGLAFEYHPDDWYFHHDWRGDGFHHWRDYHEGRGYWHDGVWVQL